LSRCVCGVYVYIRAAVAAVPDDVALYKGCYNYIRAAAAVYKGCGYCGA